MSVSLLKLNTEHLKYYFVPFGSVVTVFLGLFHIFSTCGTIRENPVVLSFACIVSIILANICFFKFSFYNVKCRLLLKLIFCQRQIFIIVIDYFLLLLYVQQKTSKLQFRVPHDELHFFCFDKFQIIFITTDTYHVCSSYILLLHR